MEPDEVFRCDRLRAVAGADHCLEMMIGGDDEVRICRDGAIGKGVVVRIAGDGVEAVTIFLTPFSPYRGESPVAIRANRNPIWLPA